MTALVHIIFLKKYISMHSFGLRGLDGLELKFGPTSLDFRRLNFSG